jgi:glycosyltransferase involved in cell wall biosynthesis
LFRGESALTSAGEPLRVLFVTSAYPTPSQPALGSFTKAQADSLRELGVGVDVLHLTAGRGLGKYVIGLRELRRRMRRNRYDIVHGFYVFSGLILLSQRRCPAIVTYLGDEAYGPLNQDGRTSLYGKLLARLSRWVIPRFANVLVQSTAMFQALGGKGMEVLPFGIDFERFRPLPKEECRARLGLCAETKYLLFANNKELPVKRFAFAEKAVSLLPDSLGAEILTLWNRASSEEMPLYYGAADALILTSVYEGSPTVVKEALACNTPIVSVDVGDVAENVNGVANSFVTPHEPSAFAEALKRVLETDARSDGRDKSRRFASRGIADRLLAIYRKALRAGAK